jgi:iron(III) transport system substrate-binding protein
MSDWWFNFKRQAGHKLLDWRDRWRALPKERQWQIAGGLLAVSTVSLVFAGMAMWRKGTAANEADVPTSVVLYTSVDTSIYTPIIDRFKAETGIDIQVVPDTEATKTTGLVQRLINERTRPRADMWWSNEASGTITLANAGLLDPFVSRQEGTMKGGWPKHLRPSTKLWYGFGQRARVIAYNTNRYTKATAPTKLRDLTKSQFMGKVGMARPQFGTTRTHIAALLVNNEDKEVRDFLTALKNNGLKLYDGNSAVVQALSMGEIEVGLTDTDDVYAGKRENWPVEMAFETPDKPNVKVTGLPSLGPLVIPNTIGRIRGLQHPNEATRLADFLLSEQVEEMLATSDARNTPIRPDLVKKLGMTPIPDPSPVAPEEIAAKLAQADRLISDLFPLQ